MFRNPEKIMRILSIFSMILLLYVVVSSLFIMIEYQEEREFIQALSNSTQSTAIMFMTEKIRPGFVEKINRFNMLQFFNAQIMAGALVLFFVSGIPTWRKNFQDPGRLIRLTPRERLIVNKVYSKIKKGSAR